MAGNFVLAVRFFIRFWRDVYGMQTNTPEETVYARYVFVLVKTFFIFQTKRIGNKFIQLTVTLHEVIQYVKN